MLRLIVGHGMRLASLGITLGLVASWLITESMRKLLYDVSPHDPAAYVPIAALLASVACIASYVPARRAVRVDPTVTLRSE